MSPLDIEAERPFSLAVITEDEQFEENPAVKVDKAGGELPLEHRKFISLLPGETVVIPDVKGRVAIKTDASFMIVREQLLFPEALRVEVIVDAEGHGAQKNEEIPFARRVDSFRAEDLKKGVPIWANKSPMARISWREK